MSSCTVHVNVVKLATSERRAVADLEIRKGGFSGECSEQRREVVICNPREARQIFCRGHFSIAWMGCRSTFVLCTALPLLSGFRAMTVCMTLAMRSCSRRQFHSN